MPDPTVAAKHPVKVTLEAGKTYHWCACGQSKGQPMCDGAHRGGEFRPLSYTATETKEVWLCQCKHTKNAPFCDGAHKNLA
jgi:CDGSH-type Zn-finger protein